MRCISRMLSSTVPTYRFRTRLAEGCRTEQPALPADPNARKELHMFSQAVRHRTYWITQPEFGSLGNRRARRYVGMRLRYEGYLCCELSRQVF